MSETSSSPTPAESSRKLMPLEVANQMYKDAFLVKRTRLAVENPQLPDVELDRRTAEYFSRLPSSAV